LCFPGHGPGGKGYSLIRNGLWERVTHYSRPDQEDGPADQIKQKKLKWAIKLFKWAVDNSEVKFLNISQGEPVEVWKILIQSYSKP
jgi:hypothetical protein